MKKAIFRSSLFRSSLARLALLQAAIIAISAIVTLGAVYFHLLVIHDVRERIEVRGFVIEGLFWALTLTAVFALAGGWWLTSRVSKRAGLIAGNVSRIAAGRLSERLPVSGSRDEIDELVSEFNRLLDRIESLTLGMRTAVDSVAHDLRGPLVRLRTRAETALLRGDAAEIRRALEQSIDDVGRVTASLEELLRIAMAESGSVALEPLNLSEMATDLAELYEPAGQENGLAFEQHVEPEVFVRGHPQLLPQAITNLLDNAMKYTPSGGTVILRLERIQSEAVLTVADTGPGIAAGQRERVLLRYVRLAETEDRPGSGLGLSLVAAVAKLHEAKLTLEDNMPGLRIALRLPVIPAG